MNNFRLTIFANMLINSSERLQHFKDSFLSFESISDDWLINIRGQKRLEAMDFLRTHLGDRLRAFELLEDDRKGGGWFLNSLEMIAHAKYDYILMWNEDHMNIAQPEIYEKIVSEMGTHQVEYLMYSWWTDGQYRKNFEVPGLKEYKYIDVINLTKDLWKEQLKKGYDKYLISNMGIFEKKFLIKLLKKERYKLPQFFTKNFFRGTSLLEKMGFKINSRKLFDFFNVLLFGKLSRWPNDRPFDIEKSPYRYDILPLKMGLPKQELFACFDDDLHHEGYQLIKRGLYPVNFDLKVSSIDLKNNKEIFEANDFYSVIAHKLAEGETFSEMIYPNINRIDFLPVMTIVGLKGELSVTVNEKKALLKSGDLVTIFSNLSHEIMAKNGNAEFLTIRPNYDKFYKI